MAGSGSNPRLSYDEANSSSHGSDRVPSQPAVAFTIPEVCAAIRMSRSFVYRLIADGALPAKKIGARTLILSEDLNAFLKSLPAVPTKTARVDEGPS